MKQHLLLDFTDKTSGDPYPQWLAGELKTQYDFEILHDIGVNEQFLLLTVRGDKSTLETISGKQMLNNMRIPYELFICTDRKFEQKIKQWLKRTTDIDYQLQREQAS